MIRLSHVSVGYPDKKVLENLSLTFPDSGAVALMAPSGYGKTTLLRVLAGLKTIEAGEISGLENKKISFLFQEDRLLPWVSAEKNVELVSDSEKARHWLKQMEIPDARQLPHEMSGGMQRRVALARAMAFGGDVLLLDEPFKGLDEALRERVASHIRDVYPLTILSVHDSAEAELMGAKIVRLDS
ncbi:MAG: ABC transporter ATP-binding protein [Clostridia bacterium]|nr:ABC transporter ATP-binding protein [Clostridia bacterium]MBR0406512.1 ABC transporter ATP-binding protein [Clostridia bacterium]